MYDNVKKVACFFGIMANAKNANTLKCFKQEPVNIPKFSVPEEGLAR